MQSIYTAASGLKNMQARLDTVANNIANVNTTGYKAKRLDFKDTLYKALEVPAEAGEKDGRAAEEARAGGAEAGTANADGARGIEYALIGSGVMVGSTTSDFSDGSLQSTNVPTDLAISGRGFFTLLSPTGETLYTRNGRFSVSGDGYLVNSEGCFVLDEGGGRIRIGGEAELMSVSAEGLIRLSGGELGRLGIADFGNPGGLEAAGNSCYRATAASGAAVEAENAALRQGSLENSNVSLADDMILLLRSQRAFSLIGKALQTADDMEGLANSIHR